MARPRTRSADPVVLGALASGQAPGDPKTTLVAQLVDTLEEAILTGTLEAGERINADVFASHYGISRIPVREALRSLEAQGWVVARPRLGYFVRPKSPAEVHDLFETRLVLEPAAAALAAERRSSAQLEAFEAIIARSRAQMAAGDGAALSQSNQEFHQLIAVATQNSVLQSMLEPLGKRVRFYTLAANSRRSTSVEEHAALVEAIRRRDAAGAAELARAHILATRNAPEIPAALAVART